VVRDQVRKATVTDSGAFLENNEQGEGGPARKVEGPTTQWGEQGAMEKGAQDLSGPWPEGIDFNFDTSAWRRLFLIHLDYFCTLNNVELKIPSDVAIIYHLRQIYPLPSLVARTGWGAYYDHITSWKIACCSLLVIILVICWRDFRIADLPFLITGTKYHPP
jgi:hypothetical protein